ncbi:MAG: SRPBCC family protein [Candidatus Melainabacteria bacterium]|nr:SRPBCC family protein [Candidatus Melainabacteria bacterium]
MKSTRRAELLSALTIMSVVSCNLMAPAMASKLDNESEVANVAITLQHPATIKQELINNRKYQVGRIVIPAKTDAVWNALTTYDRATEIYSNVKELKMIDGEGPEKRIEFNVSTMGGMMKYDYTLDVTELKAQKRIEWKRHSGAFKINDGWWQLEPVEAGTLVTYAKFIDGGFMVPQTMVNGELRKIMPSVLNNLKAAVLRAQIASK